MNKQKKEKIDYPNLTPINEINNMIYLISRFIKWIKGRRSNKNKWQ